MLRWFWQFSVRNFTMNEIFIDFTKYHRQILAKKKVKILSNCVIFRNWMSFKKFCFWKIFYLTSQSDSFSESVSCSSLVSLYQSRKDYGSKFPSISPSVFLWSVRIKQCCMVRAWQTSSHAFFQSRTMWFVGVGVTSQFLLLTRVKQSIAAINVNVCVACTTTIMNTHRTFPQCLLEAKLQIVALASWFVNLYDEISKGLLVIFIHNIPLFNNFIRRYLVYYKS